MSKININDLKDHCKRMISKAIVGTKIHEEHKLILSIINENEKLHARLATGRDYLMTVNLSDITIADCFESFGFTRDGFIIQE